MIAGTIIGGFLEDPGASGLISSGIFVDFPFLLPNFVASMMAVVALILVYPYLEETLDKSEKNDMLLINEKRSMKQIAFDPLVSKVLIVYTILAQNSTAMHELISLYLYAHIKNGGFEMDPSEIGTVLAVSSILIIFFQRFIFTSISKKYGLVGTSNITTFLAIP